MQLSRGDYRSRHLHHDTLRALDSSTPGVLREESDYRTTLGRLDYARADYRAALPLPPVGGACFAQWIP